ncbi:MAG: hypothetical protein K8J09_21550 [Planctomycetes bacterium]|nr:hypothetical protein [Planctomycetota bacterium]MCC7396218.1 hypothetical protein [Planctomycetota bacterium]
MDIGAFVQENKRWLIGCLIGAVVWFLGAQILASLFVPVRPSSKGAPTSAYDQAALDLARQEQAALVTERARLQQELAFVPSARFQLAGKGAADQYLFQLGRELKQTVLGFANDRDVAVTDQSLVWDSPTGVDEIRGQLFAMELLDEVQQRLFQAHDRVRAANPEAKGLRAITLLKLEPRRASRGVARSLRPGEVAVGDHVVQERVTFQFQADEATINDFVEALRQPGRTLLVEAFQLVKPTRVGETCTVKGALQGIAFKD